MTKLPKIVEFSQTPVLPVIPFNPPVLEFDKFPSSPPVFKGEPIIKFAPNKTNTTEDVQSPLFDLPDFPEYIRAPITTNTDFTQDFSHDLAMKNVTPLKNEADANMARDSIENPIISGEKVVNIVKYEPMIEMEARDLMVQTDTPALLPVYNTQKITKIDNEIQKNAPVESSDNSIQFGIFDAEMERELAQMGYNVSENKVNATSAKREGIHYVTGVERQELLLSQIPETHKFISSFKSPEEITNFAKYEAKAVAKEISDEEEYEIYEGFQDMIIDQNVQRSDVIHEYAENMIQHQANLLTLPLHKQIEQKEKLDAIFDVQTLRPEHVEATRKPRDEYAQEVAETNKVVLQDKPAREFISPQQDIALKGKNADMNSWRVLDVTREQSHVDGTAEIAVLFPQTTQYITERTRGAVMTIKEAVEISNGVLSPKIVGAKIVPDIINHAQHMDAFSKDTISDFSVQQLNVEKESISDFGVPQNVVSKPVAIRHKDINIESLPIIALKRRIEDPIELSELQLHNHLKNPGREVLEVESRWVEKLKTVGPVIEELSEIVCEVVRNTPKEEFEKEGSSFQDIAHVEIVSKRLDSPEDLTNGFEELLGAPTTPNEHQSLVEDNLLFEEINAEPTLENRGKESEFSFEEASLMDREIYDPHVSEETEYMCDKASLVDVGNNAIVASYIKQNAILPEKIDSDVGALIMKGKREIQYHKDATMIAAPATANHRERSGLEYDAEDAIEENIERNSAIKDRNITNQLAIAETKPGSSELAIGQLSTLPSYQKQEVEYKGRSYDFVNLKEISKRELEEEEDHSILEAMLIQAPKKDSPEQLNVEVEKIVQEKLNTQSETEAATLQVHHEVSQQFLSPDHVGNSTHLTHEKVPIRYDFEDLPPNSLTVKNAVRQIEKSLSDDAMQLQIEHTTSKNDQTIVSTGSDNYTTTINLERNMQESDTSNPDTIKSIVAINAKKEELRNSKIINNTYIPFPIRQAINIETDNDNIQTVEELEVEKEYLPEKEIQSVQNTTSTLAKRYNAFKNNENSFIELGTTVERRTEPEESSFGLQDVFITDTKVENKPEGEPPIETESIKFENLQAKQIGFPEKSSYIAESDDNGLGSTELVSQVYENMIIDVESNTTVSEPIPELNTVYAHPLPSNPHIMEHTANVRVNSGERSIFPQNTAKILVKPENSSFSAEEVGVSCILAEHPTENSEFEVASVSTVPMKEKNDSIVVPEANTMRIRLSEEVVNVGYNKLKKQLHNIQEVDDSLEHDTHFPTRRDIVGKLPFETVELGVKRATPLLLNESEFNEGTVREVMLPDKVKEESIMSGEMRVEAKLKPAEMLISSWSSDNYNLKNVEATNSWGPTIGSPHTSLSNGNSIINIVTTEDAPQVDDFEGEFEPLNIRTKKFPIESEANDKASVINAKSKNNVEKLSIELPPEIKLSNLVNKPIEAHIPELVENNRSIPTKEINLVLHVEEEDESSSSIPNISSVTSGTFEEAVPEREIIERPKARDIEVTDHTVALDGNHLTEYWPPSEGKQEEHSIQEETDERIENSSSSEQSFVEELQSAKRIAKVEKYEHLQLYDTNLAKTIKVSENSSISSVESSGEDNIHQVIAKEGEAGAFAPTNWQSSELEIVSPKNDFAPYEPPVFEYEVRREDKEQSSTYDAISATNNIPTEDSFSSYEELDIQKPERIAIQSFEPHILGPNTFAINLIKQSSMKNVVKLSPSILAPISEIEIGELTTFRQGRALKEKINTVEMEPLTMTTDTGVSAINEVTTKDRSSEAAAEKLVVEKHDVSIQQSGLTPSQEVVVESAPIEKPLSQEWENIQEHLGEYPFFVTRYEKCGKCLLNEEHEEQDKGIETFVAAPENDIAETKDHSVELSSPTPFVQDAEMESEEKVVYHNFECIAIPNSVESSAEVTDEVDKSMQLSDNSSLQMTQPNIIDFVRPKSKLPPRIPEKPLIINEVALVLPTKRMPIKQYMPPRAVEVDSRSLSTSDNSTSSSHISISSSYDSFTGNSLDSVVSVLPEEVSSHVENIPVSDHFISEPRDLVSNKELTSNTNISISERSNHIITSSDASVISKGTDVSENAISHSPEIRQSELSWEALVTDNGSKGLEHSSTSIGQVYPKVHREELSRLDRGFSEGEMFPSRADALESDFGNISREVSEGELQYMKAALALGLYE